MPSLRQYIPRFLLNVPGIKQLSGYYQSSVDKSLRGWGLRYDDLTTESSEAYTRALRLLPPDVWEARSRRLTRCTDMSAKHTHLNDQAYHAQQPRQNYCNKLVEDLERRRNERDTYH